VNYTRGGLRRISGVVQEPRGRPQEEVRAVVEPSLSVPAGNFIRLSREEDRVQDSLPFTYKAIFPEKEEVRVPPLPLRT
jgi:hypothetical protein